MTTAGFISDTKVNVKAPWSLFQHDGAAAFKLTERSPLPAALPTQDLIGGRPQQFDVCRIRRINRHPVESNEHSPSESISDTKDWLNWNGDFDNLDATEDDCTADVESDIEQGNGIEVLECPVQRDGSAAPTVSGLIRPTWNAKKQAAMVFVTVIAIERRMNKGVKKM